MPNAKKRIQQGTKEWAKKQDARTARARGGVRWDANCYRAFLEVVKD